MKHLRLLIFFLISSAYLNSGWAVTLMVDTNGLLLAPTNFFNTNASKIVDAKNSYSWRGSFQSMPHINVKDYGAKGDGVTDDTDAIQSALCMVGLNTNIAGNLGVPKTVSFTETQLYNYFWKTNGYGTTVYMPPGTYRTSRTLWLPGGTTLVGSGITPSLSAATTVGTTIRPLTNFTGFTVIKTCNWDLGEYAHNWIIVDIGIDILGAVDYGLAIYAPGEGSTIRRCHIQGARKSGMWLMASQATLQVENTFFRYCNDWAIRVTGDTNHTGPLNPPMPDPVPDGWGAGSQGNGGNLKMFGISADYCTNGFLIDNAAVNILCAGLKIEQLGGSSNIFKFTQREFQGIAAGTDRYWGGNPPCWVFIGGTVIPTEDNKTFVVLESCTNQTPRVVIDGLNFQHDWMLRDEYAGKYIANVPQLMRFSYSRNQNQYFESPLITLSGNVTVTGTLTPGILTVGDASITSEGAAYFPSVESESFLTGGVTTNYAIPGGATLFITNGIIYKVQ